MREDSSAFDRSRRCGRPNTREKAPQNALWSALSHASAPRRHGPAADQRARKKAPPGRPEANRLPLYLVCLRGAWAPAFCTQRADDGNLSIQKSRTNRPRPPGLWRDRQFLNRKAQRHLQACKTGTSAARRPPPSLSASDFVGPRATAGASRHPRASTRGALRRASSPRTCGSPRGRAGGGPPRSCRR